MLSTLLSSSSIDVSSNRMGVKINQPFANALKNKTSPQYQKLSKDVLTAVSAVFVCQSLTCFTVIRCAHGLTAKCKKMKRGFF